MTLVLIGFCQLLMRFIYLLMMDLKLVFSWIYLKPLIKSGMKGIFKLQQNGISDDLLNILSDLLEIGNKDLRLMVSSLHGPMLMQEFPRNLS